MIIDFRLRPPARGFLKLSIFRDVQRSARMSRSFGMEQAPSTTHRSPELLLREMDAAGITCGVVPGRRAYEFMGGVDNEDICAILRDYPGRFIGVAGIDPSDKALALDEIDRFVVNGPLKGVGMEPGLLPTPMYPNDRRIYPIYEKCEQAGIPLLLMGGGGNGPDASYSLPAVVDQIAADFPKLTIINTHGGYPWVTEILFVAYRRPNLYICPDMYLFNQPGWQDYVTAANFALQDRFLFGTAYPFIPLEAGVEHFKNLPFKPEVLPKVLYKNAIRALKLDLPVD